MYIITHYVSHCFVFLSVEHSSKNDVMSKIDHLFFVKQKVYTYRRFIRLNSFLKLFTIH